VLISHGVDPARIVICHVDVAIDSNTFRPAQKGVLVEFDNFGKEFYIDPPTDPRIVSPAASSPATLTA